MGNKRIVRILLAAFCILNFIGHALIYSRLPASIPIHWNVANEIDGWGPRYTDLLLALLPGAMLLLFQVLPKIDPKAENYEKFEPIWMGFMTAMVLFMGIVSWFGPLTVFGIIREGSGFVGLLISGVLGVIFIVLGNYMPRIRQNYMFGIRTPWTLADEHVWVRTHRMGGFVFILMGVLLIVLGLAAPKAGSVLTAVLVIVPVMLGCVWLFLYSYLVYQGKMR